MKALISGVAGDIGFGIGRILRNWGLFDELHGIDVTEDHPGKIIFDCVDIAPRADNVAYIDWISDYIHRHNIDLFIPTSEAEILKISRDVKQTIHSSAILMNKSYVNEICLDKHNTLAFLNSHGVAVPPHGLVGVDIPKHFPVVVKPRRGQGSKGLTTAFSCEDLQQVKKDYVWQKMLMPDDEEYTCGVYVSPKKEIRILQIRRKLIGGYTGKGEITSKADITVYVEKIVRCLNFCGCINVQLRFTKDGPLLFEINPRLSSTVVFRDILGFQDLRWWVGDFLDLVPPPYEAPITGTKIYRGNSEYVVKAFDLP
jgi:carbamoyl-phosphate synthase large subunit